MGRLLYSSGLFFPLKIIILFISIFLFANIFFQTQSDPGFISFGGKGLKDVFFYQITHPQEIITYLILFVFPAIYYGFFRANRFFEKGLLVNGGLPFYNEFIEYSHIGHFQIVHSKYLISVFSKKDNKELLIPVKDMERVLAILDQNGIEGKLQQEMKVSHFLTQTRYLYFLVAAGAVTFLVQYYNVAYYFWRAKWW